jgi:hypothetical protein
MQPLQELSPEQVESLRQNCFSKELPEEEELLVFIFDITCVILLQESDGQDQALFPELSYLYSISELRELRESARQKVRETGYCGENKSIEEAIWSAETCAIELTQQYINPDEFCNELLNLNFNPWAHRSRNR